MPTVRRPPPRRLRQAAAGLVLLCVVGLVAHVAAVHAGEADRTLFSLWVYCGVIAAATALCFVGAWMDRVAPLTRVLLGLALLVWLVGEVYWELALAKASEPPYPSWADLGYLAFYPLAAAAILVRLRIEATRLRATVALDAFAGALAATALAMLALYPHVRDATGAGAAQIVTNAAYPVGDVAIIALVVVTVALMGRRLHATPVLILAGLAVLAATDAIYLGREATGTYAVGTLLDTGWMVGAVLLGLACLNPARWSAHRREVDRSWWLMAAPTLVSGIAISVLAVDHFHRTNRVTLWLAVAALVVVVVRLNVTFGDNRRLLATLREQSRTDVLTGLLNRRGLAQAMSRELALTARRGGVCAVLVLDVDNFKYVNDMLGHQAGDEVIRAVGRALATELREGDVLARLGGDEFAVVLPDTNEGGAGLCASRLCERMRRTPVVADLPEGKLTISVGVAVVDDPGTAGWESVLARADTAMYAAKDAGRDGWALHGGEGEEAGFEDGFGWSARLRRALDEGGLELYAQPIVDVQTGAVHLRELLLRLRDEDGRVWLPGAFLPAAERFGLLRPLDRWVVRRAAELLAGSRGSFSINLSAQALADPEFADEVLDALAECGADPSRFVIEITETTAIRHLETAKEVVVRLREGGCRVAVDDFGVGYGSFSYLKHLPCDMIKIDGSFVRDLCAEPVDRALVGAIVHAARRLGVATVAEHVGDEETLELLRRMGVDLAQGFHLGRPEPIDQPARSTLSASL